jgi:hypothetical protein
LGSHTMLKSPAALEKLFTALSGDSVQALPLSMQRASRFMFGGAAVTAVWGIFLVIVTAVNNEQLSTTGGTKASSGQILGGVIYDILITIILVAAWILMARMNQRGRNWARIVSSVLFLLWSFETYLTVGSIDGSVLIIVNAVIVIVIWLAGFAALFSLWRPDSSDYFRSAAS